MTLLQGVDLSAVLATLVLVIRLSFMAGKWDERMQEYDRRISILEKKAGVIA